MTTHTARSSSTMLPKGRNLALVFWLEAKYEFLKNLRLPVYAVSTIVFPLMFYVLFGLLFGSESAGGVSMATYMLATYGALGVIGAAFMNIYQFEKGRSNARLRLAQDELEHLATIAERERIARDALSEVRAAVSGYRASGFTAELANAKLALEPAGVSFAFAATPRC